MEFEKSLIKLNQQFANKEEAIRYCGQLLVDGGYVSPDYVDAMVQVPKGVNFGTEAEPQIATVLFGIAGLGDEHLELIQKISIFCADVDNVVKLADAQTQDDVIRLLNSVE